MKKVWLIISLLSVHTLWSMQNFNNNAGIDRENNTVYIMPGRAAKMNGRMINVRDNGIFIDNEFHAWEGLTKIGIKNNKIYVYGQANVEPIELCDIPVKKATISRQTVIHNTGTINIEQYLGKSTTNNITNIGTGNVYNSGGDIIIPASGWNIGSSLYSVWNTLKSIKIPFTYTKKYKYAKEKTEYNLNPLSHIEYLCQATKSLCARAYVYQKPIWPCYWMKYGFPWPQKPANIIASMQDNQSNESTKEDETQAEDSAPTYAPPVKVVSNNNPTPLYPNIDPINPTAPTDEIDVSKYVEEINNSPQFPVQYSAGSGYPFPVYNMSPQPQTYPPNIPGIPQTPINNPLVSPINSYYQSTGTAIPIPEPIEIGQSIASKHSEQKNWIIDTLISNGTGDVRVTCNPTKQEGPFLKRPSSNILTHNTDTDLVLNLPGLCKMTATGCGFIDVEGIGSKILSEEATKDITLSIAGSGDISLNRKTGKRYIDTLHVIVNGSGDCYAKNLSARNVHTVLQGGGNANVKPINTLTGFTSGCGRVICYTPHSNLETDFEGEIEFK